MSLLPILRPLCCQCPPGHTKPPPTLPFPIDNPHIDCILTCNLHRHLGHAPAGDREAFRPFEKTGFLVSRRKQRESRVRPWLANGTFGNGDANPRASIDNSKAASRRQETHTRIQARTSASSSARTQASRQPARTQASTRAAPTKASTSSVRTQATQPGARFQATEPRRTVGTKPSRLIPECEPKAFAILLHRDRIETEQREAKRNGGFLKKRLPPRSDARSTGSGDRRQRPAGPPPSAPSTLPSGGQSSVKVRRGGSVATASSAVSVPKTKTEPTAPVDTSSLPAGVYEKVRREGSDGPAYTLKKVSWRFMGGYENIFSPPQTRVVITPEPEVEVEVNRPSTYFSKAPSYERLYTTPRRQDCARPRRRLNVAPLLPVPPPDQSVSWQERSETRLTSAGSVATEATSEGPQGLKVSGSSVRPQSLQLCHSLGSVGHAEPAHRSAAPARSALRNGSSRMAKKHVVRFDDNVRERIVSRWVTDVYSEYKTAGSITAWQPHPDWNPDPEHPSERAHICTWSTMTDRRQNHHRMHHPTRLGPNGPRDWDNCCDCAPHLRELDWDLPCPYQHYSMPAHEVLGVQGECTCEQSGPYGCPRKVFRKRLDLLCMEQAVQGLSPGKATVLRRVLAGMAWAGGRAVIPRTQ